MILALTAVEPDSLIFLSILLEVRRMFVFCFCDFFPQLKLEGGMYFHAVGSSRSDLKSMTMRQYCLAIPLIRHSLSQHEAGLTVRH